MDALGAHSDVPAAPMIGYEADASVLGAPFFVMGFVGGHVPVEDPALSRPPVSSSTSRPADRTAMIERDSPRWRMLHTVDWRAAELDFLVPPGVTPGLAAQLDALASVRPTRASVARASARRISAFAVAEARNGRPQRGRAVPGVTRDPGTSSGVTRRRRASPTSRPRRSPPPELDVGWWLMFDRTMHEWSGVERAEGDPTRAEQLRMYEAASGRAVPDARGSRSARRRATAPSSCG